MSGTADHLCVLVHGLWGNPEHLKYLSTTLRERFPEDKVHILVAKRNAGSFTYDGIDTGGERVADEVEQKLEELARSGHDIKKISVIGYSLGGLIARYAIGLLYHKGVFERIQPVNFTTFATPHLGVRTPLKGYHSQIWNVLGARTLSMSGRQLFGIDKLRDTGRSLLSVLADPESIFIQALARFQHRSLYANVVNDRTVTYYTAGISQTDPFVKPDGIKINYIPGYDEVIIDGEDPVAPKEPEDLPAFTQRFTTGTRTILGRVPIVAFLAVFIPIGSTLFLMNSLVQSFRSQQRIRLHEEGRAGADFGRYRIPLMINAVRQEAEDMFENVNNAQGQDYLSAGSEEVASPTQPTSPGLRRKRSTRSDVDSIQEQKSGLAIEFPTLALTQDQFGMIEALDNVGFKKHPVYIHNHRHSHAAIIVRMDKKSFDEGRVVVKHWLDNFVF
ncbi:lipase/serine esteras-like protein [Cucurbitaria berberidis CBS 394.84]|uniref:Lipase/serine esteras-like protein n=1 Tax=Cucurbitaria berberidis CBS 394.84 TaxID=1168544 RepID=A0A9P4LBU5_9PLEO|nr:lipase/serine esteras-like protein [Cucurbitaria berberidis CBS 394.84]KAF1849410.1 lipase/serine esteras-like protein [Cucurbitaria berberidis CBS 394.84]